MPTGRDSAKSLVNGQNMVWPFAVVTIEVLGLAACDLSGLILGADDLVRDSADFAFYNQPTAPGVRWQAGPPQRLDVTLSQLPTERFLSALSLDDDQPAFGAQAPPTLRLGDGTQVVAEFVPRGLSTERAVLAIEVYRRAGQWKIRAIGQGYDGGLAELVRAHGVEVDDEPATTPTATRPAPAGGGQSAQAQPRTTSAPAPGGATMAQPTTTTASGASSLPEAPGVSPVWPARTPVRGGSEAEFAAQSRLFSQSSAILDDASRSTASLLSTRDYAAASLQRELERLVGDPRTRTGPVADQARADAQRVHDDLVRRAEASHRRDLLQLIDEVSTWRQQLPAPLADWDSPAWQNWRPEPVTALGVRIGDLTLPEPSDPKIRLHVPFLLRAPLLRPMLIDPSLGGPAAAAAMLKATVTRLVACYPPDGVAVSVIDPDGVSLPLAPLGAPGCRVQSQPAAVNLPGIRARLHELVAHVDRVAMAREAGLADAVDARDQLVVITDFPVGFDEECLNLLLQLVTAGPAAGMQFVLTGSQSQGPLPPAASTLFASFNPVPAGPGGSITDGFGGIEWQFVPDLGPADPHLLERVLTRISHGE